MAKKFLRSITIEGLDLEQEASYHKLHGLMNSIIKYLADACCTPAIDIRIGMEGV